MRSKKNLVIGFLLLLLGIGLSEYSLLLSVLAGVAGIVMMILYAAGKLKRNTAETSAVTPKTSEIQPTTKTQQANAQSVTFSQETQQLYQQLAEQYTQIVNNGCFGTLSQIEEKMGCCKRFLEQWMEAICNKDFVPLLRNKAKYDEYLKGFRLPQFGAWRTIQAEGGDDSIPDGLTKALVGRIQGKQKMLQEFWEAQKWFEELIASLDKGTHGFPGPERRLISLFSLMGGSPSASSALSAVVHAPGKLADPPGVLARFSQGRGRRHTGVCQGR